MDAKIDKIIISLFIIKSIIRVIESKRMSLKKYMACDEGHYNDFEYVCLK